MLLGQTEAFQTALGVCNSFINTKCTNVQENSSNVKSYMHTYQVILMITLGTGEFIENAEWIVTMQHNTLSTNKVQLYLIPFALEWMQFDAE